MKFLCLLSIIIFLIIPHLNTKAQTGVEGHSPIFSKVIDGPVANTPGDSRSVNWIDINNDGYLDLFISNGPSGGANNYLYLNDGSGGFSAVIDQPIVQDKAPSDGATWADYDNDGDMDCFVVNWYGANNLFYRNNGDGTFEQVTMGDFTNNGGYSETASWGDYDQDGYLDLYVSNSGGNKRNFLYHNNGDGTLSRIISGAPVTDVGTSRSINWTDFDLDGDLDLFVTNENYEHENMYRNDAGNFIKITGGSLLTAAGSTISSSWGDFDNDGDLDVFLANDQSKDGLYRNNNGVFEKVTNDPVVNAVGNSFGSQWADVDNDGDLDLFVTHAFWGGLWKNSLFLNQGDGSFLQDDAEVVSSDQGWSYGCAFGDYDRDGDLDLAVANCYNASQKDYLYENHSAENGNNWIMINCIGTISNKNAIGAKVWVYTTLNGQVKKQLREISAQSGYCGQNQLTAHFGLGQSQMVDSILIQWPNAQLESFPAKSVNQYINLIEGPVASSVTEQLYEQITLLGTPNPFFDSVSISWQSAIQEKVQIDILDTTGKSVYSIQKETASGEQRWTWNGVDNQGVQVSEGVYFIRIQGQKWRGTLQLVRH